MSSTQGSDNVAPVRRNKLQRHKAQMVVSFNSNASCWPLADITSLLTPNSFYRPLIEQIHSQAEAKNAEPKKFEPRSKPAQ